MFAPIHEETGNAGLPIVANQASYDITDDPDPQIGEKMAQVHRDRFGSHLRELIKNMNYTGLGRRTCDSPSSGTSQPRSD